MECTVTQFKRCDVVKVKGRIDNFTAPQLAQVLTDLQINNRFRIVCDMSEVDFLSSAGWWTLIRAQKTSRRWHRGEVVLVGLKEPIRDSMKLVGIGPYFKQFDDVAAAVGSF
jgi:anti-sigma B factor antagonist